MGLSMSKFIFFILLGFFEISHSYGPYFQYDFNHLDQAKERVSQLRETAQQHSNRQLRDLCDHFLRHYDSAKRPTVKAVSENLPLSIYKKQYQKRYVRAWEKSPNFSSVEAIIDQVPPDNRESFRKEADTDIERAKKLLPLYGAYRDFYGPWREYLFRDFIPLSDDTPKNLADKKTLFTHLIKAGFIVNSQVDLDRGINLRDFKPLLEVFLADHPEINTLRLGDEKMLNHRVYELLGVTPDGMYGYRPFTKDDLNPFSMYISNLLGENNDIVADAHDPQFWKDLLEIKGEGFFESIRDLSWYIFQALPHQKESKEGQQAMATLRYIFRALKPKGEFSIWNTSFEMLTPEGEPTGNLKSDDEIRDLVKCIRDVGFRFDSQKSQKDTLVFIKP